MQKAVSSALPDISDVPDIQDVQDILDVPEMDENTITLDEASEGADETKFGTPPSRQPWEKYDPSERVDPKLRFALPLNRHDRAIVKALAMWQDTTMQDAIIKLIREAGARAVKRHERPTRRKGDHAA